MAELLGIIAPIKKFLSDTDEKVTMFVESQKNTILSFDSGRV